MFSNTEVMQPSSISWILCRQSIVAAALIASKIGLKPHGRTVDQRKSANITEITSEEV